ncbi:hypothetical protein QBC35DRAFT_444854 [Podospora australis]|uniref:4-coumarate--CoA ligase n=1 Tax=Podospora australis TaxID=1536484 RepID=A0AAN7ADK0_9PEZI|nr:hypothetical protein QBC35DRAFT_444854 [Podospora australis]
MPFDSTFPPLDIPEDVDLWSLLFAGNQRPFPANKKILTCPETHGSYTWSDLREASINFGRGLQEQYAWKKGDVLAFYTPNSIDTPILTLGALYAGAIVSPSNPLYTPEELAFQLRDSSAKALVTQPAYLPTAIAAAKKASLSLSRIILLGSQDASDFPHFASIHPSPSSPPQPVLSISPKVDPAFLVYSSGTTGLPKGVILTHYNMVANILQASATEGSQWSWSVDKQLAFLPFFHIYGLTCCVLLSIYSGWETIVLERFDLAKCLSAIATHRITFLYCPPPVILAFSKSPLVSSYDLSSLKVLHSGAAPLTKELTLAVWDRLKIPVKQGFGLSETSAVVCCQMVPEWKEFMGSVGQLMPNMQAKLVDPSTGKEETQEGELWLKGPNVFRGYYKNEQKTKEAFSRDGYFMTGDVFRRDGHGNFYCVDRLKELIKYNGYPVPPAELEGILVGHKDVADACVVGIEDKALATEAPRAYVVLREGVTANPAKAQELVDLIASKVAPHKKLRGGIRFVDSVPKSPSGKVLRRLMRDQAKAEERAAGSKL